MSYRSEFSQIEKTSFWKSYTAALESARDGLLMNLSKGKISVPVTQGEAWQAALRVVEQMLDLPWKMVGDE